MTVLLEGIKFNYDPDLKTGAFNIRHNETTPVNIPEWVPGQAADFKSSPAAYSINAVPNGLTIQASFRVDGGLQGPVKVKAVAISPDKILGDSEMVSIPAAGSSGFITLKLPKAQIKTAKIGINDITWSWQFSTPSVSWTEFQRTNHRIYTVLFVPPEPWEATSRAATNIHQPWTEVLDLACEWAAGVSGDPDPAATLIAREFFRRVSAVAKYKSAGSFAFSKFKITKFLRLLANDNGVSHRVNCDDCATVVSTFANIVGCELSQSSMGTSFRTHEVVLVGAQQPQTTGFRYHAVAWKGNCGVTDDVFDGCLQLDEDPVTPFSPVQPADIPFGDDRKGYKSFLVNNSPGCHPLADHADYGRRRRKFGNTTYLADAAIKDRELISELKRDFAFDSWPAFGSSVIGSTRAPSKEDGIKGTRLSFAGLFKGFVFSDWSFHSGDLFNDDRFPEVFDALLTRSDLLSDALLAATVYQTSETSDPNLNLLEILARLDDLDLKRLTRSRVGNVAFADSDSSTVVFRRNRLLAIVQSAGQRQLSVIKEAQQLDRLLIAMSGDSIEVSSESKLIARRSSMDHIFKELRSINTYGFDEHNHLVLKPAGSLIIDKIQPDGEIPVGYHIDDTNTPHEIKGRAYKYKGDFYLTFSHVDGTDTFSGRLVSNRQDEDHLVVVGSIVTDTDPDPVGLQAASSDLLDQVEQPIIISKP